MLILPPKKESKFGPKEPENRLKPNPLTVSKNFLEKTGRFIFQKNRMPIFLLFLSIGPLVSAFFLYIEKQSFNALEETSSIAMRKTKTAFHRKTRKDAFLAKHENSDPYFLDKEIESLCFLNKEKDQLKEWLSHPAISNKDKLMRRVHFLESAENRLSFTEEDIQVSKTCKETMEKQRYPIEVDADDLKLLLHHIEELPTEQINPNDLSERDIATSAKGRPQLLICNFSMIKKNTLLQNEVFEIKMDLLKREFLAK
jgi:hypothetical protein